MFALKSIHSVTVAGTLAAALFCSAASANPLPLFPFFGQFMPPTSERPVTAMPQEQRENGEQPAQFRRQIVEYRTGEAAGTVIIDTPHTYLY
jgi:lipoprotein-anchoring transpeptidase ErfK/SrfK